MRASCLTCPQKAVSRQRHCPVAQRAAPQPSKRRRRCNQITRCVAEAPPQKAASEAEAQVLKQLQQAVEAGRAPSKLLFLFGAFYSSYQGEDLHQFLFS